MRSWEKACCTQAARASCHGGPRTKPPRSHRRHHHMLPQQRACTGRLCPLCGWLVADLLRQLCLQRAQLGQQQLRLLIGQEHRPQGLRGAQRTSVNKGDTGVS